MKQWLQDTIDITAPTALAVVVSLALIGVHQHLASPQPPHGPSVIPLWESSQTPECRGVLAGGGPLAPGDFYHWKEACLRSS